MPSQTIAAPNSTAARTMTSFLIRISELKAAQKAAATRDIPVSVWFREAAKEKLRRESKRKSV